MTDAETAEHHGPAHASRPVSLRRRVRRVRRRLRRRRRKARLRYTYFRYSPGGRRVRWGLLGVGALVLLGAVWILVTALLARRQIETLNNRLLAVRILVAQGQLGEAQKVATSLPGMADRAHRLTTGPAWWLGSQVPYLGDPLDVARGLTDAAQDLGHHAVPQLLDVADAVDPSTLRAKGDTVRLGPLTAAVPKLEQAQRTIRDAERNVQDLPSSTWLGAIDRGRSTLNAQLDSLGGYVDAATRAARVLPVMLGEDGKVRRYFIGLQNEAELRGTGGIPGAFAIARTQNGTLTFERFESDAALLPGVNGNRIDTGLDFGRDYNALYGAGRPTQEFNDSNASPQFPYAARIWAAMWQKRYHQHIDGALAMDPTVLSYFLAVTGPAVVPGQGSVAADNVVALTQKDNYALFSDNTQRRKYLVAVLRAASKKLTSGVGSPIGLVQAASRAAAERRLLVWSSDPSVQKLLEQTTYAGDIAGTSRPLSALILNNSAAGKLDYYLQRSISYSRTGCGSRRDVNVTITLKNTAPGSGLPPYVTTRLDQDRPAGVQPGDSRVTLDYYATGDALVQSASLNGTRVGVNVSPALGRTVVRMDVELPHGQTQTIELHLDEPVGRGTPELWAQPGVTPLNVTGYMNQVC